MSKASYHRKIHPLKMELCPQHPGRHYEIHAIIYMAVCRPPLLGSRADQLNIVIYVKFCKSIQKMVLP
ncbi:MAG: hypothetical protein KDC49_22140, partial [Saprospiraceae bacterium]|nr:hypothetical protein [Saprospiraceae bacterium]